MKKFIILGFLFLFCSPCVFTQNDFYVKINEHRDSFYEWGETSAPQDITIEMWIGDNRYAYISSARNFLFDYEKDSITVINKSQKAYFTIPMPMDLKKYLDSNQIQKMNRIMGSVKDINEEKIIKDHKCRTYEIENYIVIDEVHVYDIVNKSFVTRDVPFNLNIYKKSIYNINRFTNFEEEYLKEMDKVEGFPLKAEIILYQRGDKMTRQREAVEIIQKAPGKDVYSIPPGFTKKEKITLAEIQGR
jgi:hypothetical protein